MSQNQFAELLQRARREKQAALGPAAAAASVQPLSLFDQCTPCSAAHSIGRDMVYVPGFLDADAASSFAAHIEASAPSWGGWARLHRRSLLNMGGVPHPSGTIAELLPRTLQQLCGSVHRAGALPFVPDQCLLNRSHVTPPPQPQLVPRAPTTLFAPGPHTARRRRPLQVQLRLRHPGARGRPAVPAARRDPVARAPGLHPLLQNRASSARCRCSVFRCSAAGVALLFRRRAVHRLQARDTRARGGRGALLLHESRRSRGGQRRRARLQRLPLQRHPPQRVARGRRRRAGRAAHVRCTRPTVCFCNILPMYLEERQRRRAWWLSSINEKNDASPGS